MRYAHATRTAVSGQLSALGLKQDIRLRSSTDSKPNTMNSLAERPRN
ncbi:MAG: hypothetical protein F6J98_04265 [Moorea sp. SIO4G2]|nr:MULTISPECIES: hypothetical protein [unclassified Moorena]NEO11042.1 hypothetical protein [Moorena sp. SIO3E8]NEO59661.1 hypothetical protein [Moorena sp. SIO4G2]NEP99156.1 hypothetical protein [Moorena sp. SIO3F7]